MVGGSRYNDKDIFSYVDLYMMPLSLVAGIKVVLLIKVFYCIKVNQGRSSRASIVILELMSAVLCPFT